MSKYAIYPSLLDAYTWMQGAEDGEAYAQRKQELIDKLCRIPQPPAYAASRGTALNNLVDALIAKQGAENIGVVDCGDSHFYTVKQDGFDFAYDGALADKVADIVKGSVAQPFLSAEIETDHGTVRLYGYADYVNGAEVIDLKSTSTYTVGKYREHWQHYVYPYCLVRGGLTEDFHNFTYLVAELNAGRDGLLKGNIYTESYNPTIEECERTIRQFLDSQFLPFLEDNRAAITDGKVFGREHNHRGRGLSFSAPLTTNQMRKPIKPPQPKPRVYCSECRHFRRDTEGISRRLETGEYFMGECLKGLHPDSPIKQFADKPRECGEYQKLQ